MRERTEPVVISQVKLGKRQVRRFCGWKCTRELIALNQKIRVLILRKRGQQKRGISVLYRGKEKDSKRRDAAHSAAKR